MTRINVAILPSELTGKHLIAEHREIKRIPNNILNGISVLDGKYPTKFVLGTGHVKFFYNKLKYLHKRYENLYQECKRRGYNVEYYGNVFDEISRLFPKLYNDYEEQPEDRLLLIERINSKLPSHQHLK